jgi:AraC-like DNA-binding protein
MIYVLLGEVRAFFGSGWHTLKAGDILFVPPGCIHRCLSDDDTAEQLVIGFTDELICDASTDRSGVLRPYRSGFISDASLFSSEELPGISEAMTELRSFSSNEPSELLKLTSEVLYVYSRILSLWEKRGAFADSQMKSHIANGIMSYVSEHFSERISARALTEKFSISYSYLSKIMSREFGMSLGDYIIFQRIEHAKKLLVATGESVAEIAYACGFPSSSAFISHFKAQTGKTPLIFRKTALSVN